MSVKVFIRREWLQLLLLLTPFAVIPFIWEQLPEQIATHWNLQGEVNDYSSKSFGVFSIPIVNILVTGLIYLLPSIDPRKTSYTKFVGTLRVIRLILSTMLLLIFFVIIGIALGYDINVGAVISLSTLFVFLVLGNYMGNIRSNYFIGIRTPWTLEYPEIWRKTHRMAGYLWVWASLAMILFWLILPEEIYATAYYIYIGIIALVPVLYSFILFKKGPI